ncbi:phage portal protein [Aestuariibaculum marinum]|uniref:Phage portal protein n=1 Tax=Aestuariibaculum marinum TaxID=2683592 RepID=A0A8J6U6C4_9FLAO|nr:phage portal protein [Aestuariibaculum marinum]MBD0822626.1 phage portal protein [Aestuariibaculum marinum]
MDFLELIKSKDYKAAKELLSYKEGIESNTSEFKNIRDIRDTQVGKRSDKTTKDGTVKVSKIPIPFQRQIVKAASTFLLGSPVKIIEKKDSENEDKDGEAFFEVMNNWDDMRMDSTLLKFCKAVKSETEASIVFFSVQDEATKSIKIKSRLITSDNGKVSPVFDVFGDMVAFNWEYVVKENGKDVTYWYCWTAETMYAVKGDGSTFTDLEGYPKANLFKKIPAVYMSQENPEWWEVQELIDRFEMSFSKFADTNDYFASPMYKAKGAVKSIPKKDETGKLVKLDIVETDKGNIIEADLDVISWDRAPEALKLEFETNKGLIYGLTDTPDLTFDNVKGIGNVSGIALKLMFLGPILKAKEGEGEYKIAISRILNIIKSGILNITKKASAKQIEELRMDILFTSVLPENFKEIIEMLSEASGGKAIMSQKSAVSHNPLVDNVEEEMDNIKEEAATEAIGSLGETVV